MYHGLDGSGAMTDVTDRVSKSTPGQFSFSWTPLPSASSSLFFDVNVSDPSFVVLNPGESVFFSVSGQMPYRGSSNQVQFVFQSPGSSLRDSVSQSFTVSGSASEFSVSLMYTNDNDSPYYFSEVNFSTSNPNGGSYTGFRLTVTDFVITDYSQNGQDRYDTDQITGAIESQTDEITNGWDSNIENDENDQLINDYTDQEDALMDDTQDGRDEVETINQNAIQSITSKISAFTSIAALMNGFINCSWMTNALFVISASCGLIAVILGVGHAIFGRLASDSSPASKRSKNDDGQLRWF